MKLKFDKNLDYQQQAIASVVDLFRGKRLCILILPYQLIMDK